MAPVARMKERDQRFLLIGIGPLFKEKPERAAAANPRMHAQTLHLKKGRQSDEKDLHTRIFISGPPDNSGVTLLMHDKYATSSCSKPHQCHAKILLSGFHYHPNTFDNSVYLFKVPSRPSGSCATPP